MVKQSITNSDNVRKRRMKSMKRNLAIFFMGMTIATMVLGGCGDKENISKKDGKESESVEDKKTFTVGFDAEYPPYGYMDENGEYTGFDLELAEAVCELEGWELVKKPINWDSKRYGIKFRRKLIVFGMDLL